MTEHTHVDTFVRDRLPPRDRWPRMDWSVLPDLAYPDTLNVTTELVDCWIQRGQGERVALHHADGPWTYQRLADTANRIAHVLVDDCGLVPGGRVLLRSPNHPMLVACWLAVLRAGGVAVSTMALLRLTLPKTVEQAVCGSVRQETGRGPDTSRITATQRTVCGAKKCLPYHPLPGFGSGH